MVSSTTSLGASFWNQFEDGLLRDFRELKEFFLRELMVDGHPPFTDWNDERREYEQLVTMRMLPGSAYWSDPEAPRRLAQLAMKYGPPPAPFASPFNPGGPG